MRKHIHFRDSWAGMVTRIRSSKNEQTSLFPFVMKSSKNQIFLISEAKLFLKTFSHCLNTLLTRKIIKNLSLFPICWYYLVSNFFKQGLISEIFRSSCTQMFFKISVLKNVINLTGKHLRCSLFLIKLKAFRPVTLLKRDSNTSRIFWS